MLTLIITAAVSLYFVHKEDRRGILTIAFLNIGQGDSIFIDSPSGNQLLIDGGPGKSVLSELSALMPFYDRSIDVIIATHADQDHVGGLPDVLQRYKVNLFMEPGVAGESSSYEELERMINEKEKRGVIKKILARRGMVIDLGEGVKLHILFPDRDPVGMETNMSSVVAKLVYGEHEFMLTGDSPSQIEGYLVTLGGVESDVLKAGHHGSKTSTSESFVKAVSPEYAVISVGKDNRYSHPTAEVLETLSKLNVQILRTDTQGRIVFKSDGVNLKVK